MTDTCDLFVPDTCEMDPEFCYPAFCGFDVCDSGIYDLELVARTFVRIHYFVVSINKPHNVKKRYMMANKIGITAALIL